MLEWKIQCQNELPPRLFLSTVSCLGITFTISRSLKIFFSYQHQLAASYFQSTSTYIFLIY